MTYTREQGLKVLRIVKKILDDLEVPFFIAHGTCLFAIREKDLNLTDIDLGILGEYSDKYDEIKKAFESLGVRFKNLGAEKYAKLLGKKLNICFTMEGVWVDILFYYKYKNYRWHLMNPISPYIVSSYLFDSLKKINLFGISLLVPNPPEKYLEENYGKNWRIPNKRPFCCDETLYGGESYPICCPKCGKKFWEGFGDFTSESIKLAKKMNLWEKLKDLYKTQDTK